MTTAQVGFTVDAEGLTGMARQLWLEGKHLKAYRLLAEGLGGISDEVVFAIIGGSAKLENVGGGMRAVADSWDPQEAYGKGARYVGASMRGMLDEMQAGVDFWTKWRDRAGFLEHVAAFVHAAQGRKAIGIGGRETGITHASPIGYVRCEYVVRWLAANLPEPNRRQWDEFWKVHGASIRDMLATEYAFSAAERKDRVEEIEKKRAPRKKPEGPIPHFAMWDAGAAGDVDATIAIQGRIDREPCPEPDPELRSGAGYVLKDGRFYPCVYMGHSALASKLSEKLGISEDDPEKGAERLGWVRVSTSPRDHRASVVLSPIQPDMTVDQALTVKRWCDRHGAEFPR